jgi:hypothetical protein
MADPDKLKEYCPKRFHRKESLYPCPLPHRSLLELLRTVRKGVYDELPSKGRGHKGTAIRVWRRHVNVADRLQRRREIKALWRVGVRDVLGETASQFTFMLAEHEAYMIYYCLGAETEPWERATPVTHVPMYLGELSDESRAFIEHAREGWYPSLDFSSL